MKIVALAGGVGASKLLWGLVRAMAPEDLTVVVNTGDDLEMHGLTICPDLDIVTYTLAGAVNTAAGWGIGGDSFAALEWLGRYGRPTWFNLGDRDLATHIHRTAMLREGVALSECADAIRSALGVRSRILPMSDQRVRTMIHTANGILALQNYLVERRAAPVVKAIEFDGAAWARPAPGVLEAIDVARGIVICPSNPLISIAPILAVPGIREALAARRSDVVAVCPIVGGRSLKGPSDKMMAELDHQVSAVGVARMYRDVAGRLVLDHSDARLRAEIETLGVGVEVTNTVMQTDNDKRRLGEFVCSLFAGRRRGASAAGD